MLIGRLITDEQFRDEFRAWLGENVVVGPLAMLGAAHVPAAVRVRVARRAAVVRAAAGGSPIPERYWRLALFLPYRASRVTDPAPPEV